MSIAKSVAVFLLSSIFTFSLLTLVTTHTLGDSFQKDNLKAFASSQLGPGIMGGMCEEECQKFEGITEDNLPICIEQCLQSVEMKRNETDAVIDQMYEQDIMGQSMNETLSMMNQPLLFFAITALSAALILIFAKNPLSTLGKDIISTASITLLIALLLPDLVLMFSGASTENVISEYLGSGLYTLRDISIALIISGIVLVLTEYLVKWIRKKKSKKKKK